MHTSVDNCWPCMNIELQFKAFCLMSTVMISLVSSWERYWPKESGISSSLDKSIRINPKSTPQLSSSLISIWLHENEFIVKLNLNIYLKL